MPSRNLVAGDRRSIAQQLAFHRGEDLTLDFQLVPAADVSAWTVTLKVADKLGGTVQFTKSATITDGPRGKFRVVVASADTAALAIGRYIWDCRRTDSGNKTTLADGHIDLKQEVTA
jgi:hypothetical protein